MPIQRFRSKLQVKPGSKLDLSKRDPDYTGSLEDKKSAEKLLKKKLKRLKELQYLLYAEDKRSLLVVFQAMDAGGKDGVIRRVLGPLNPQGCRVASFKQPNSVEQAHDFLWRIHHNAPPKGMIHVFNRSHYEDVLVVRVHDLVPRKVWSKRYKHINDFEEMLTDNGVHILKFFLHISKEEQLARFQDRLNEPDRHWKFSPADVKERKCWNKYQLAFNDALTKCSTPHAPWYVIPANKKWFRNLAVCNIICETLAAAKMKFPEVKFDVSKIKLK